MTMTREQEPGTGPCGTSGSRCAGPAAAGRSFGARSACRPSVDRRLETWRRARRLHPELPERAGLRCIRRSRSCDEARSDCWSTRSGRRASARTSPSCSRRSWRRRRGSPRRCAVDPAPPSGGSRDGCRGSWSTATCPTRRSSTRSRRHGAQTRADTSTRDAGGLYGCPRLDAQCASRDAPRIETIR